METLERTNIRISLSLQYIEEELKEIRTLSKTLESIESRVSRIEGMLIQKDKQRSFLWDVVKLFIAVATGAAALRLYDYLI